MSPTPTNYTQTYKQYLDFMQYEVETSYRYLRIAEDFLSYSEGKLSRDEVMAYLGEYSDCSSTYRRWIMIVLKGLFQACGVQWPFSKRELPKISKPSQPYLKFEQAELLIKEALALSPLDYALVCVDAVTGARREELTEMLREEYSQPYLVVRTRKGGNTKTRTLDPGTCSALDTYLSQRRDSSPYLFVNTRGEQFSPQGLTERFQVLQKRCGFKKGVGWHSIRRGVATWLYRNGMKEKEIQELIGWKTPSMVSRYIQLEAGEVEKKAEGANPMFRRRRGGGEEERS